MLCFQSFLGLAISDIYIQRLIVGNVFYLSQSYSI